MSVLRGAYVISMPTSERINTFYAATDAKMFNTFTAVDGSTVENFDENQFLTDNARMPRNGEKGCTMSHFSLYQQFAADAEASDDDWILIAEDDCLLRDGFEKSVNKLATKAPVHSDMILLGDYCTAIDNPVIPGILTDRGAELSVLAKIFFDPTPNFIFRRVGLIIPKHQFGTLCYLVRKRACRKIVDIVSEEGAPFWVADDHPLFHKCGVRIYKLSAPIAQTFDSVGEIGSGYRPLKEFNSSFRARLRLKYRLDYLRKSLEPTKLDLQSRRKRR